MKMTLESRELKKVVRNLNLENLSLSEKGKKKVVEVVNTGTEITPTLIKALIKHDEI